MPDTSDVGGSDSVPQDSSLVLGWRRYVRDDVREGVIIKNRKGHLGTFYSSFNMDPVDLSGIDEDMVHEIDGEEESDEDRVDF